MGGPTLDLAGWIAGLAPDAIPERSRAVIRHAVLDTLACALHGRELEWTRIAARWARGAAGPATVWGDDDAALRTEMAAFVNGVAAHAFELDDYHPNKLHSGAVVIPAALAIGERADADGARLLTAIAVGYEVMARVAAALDPATAKSLGWHITGITGPFGAAAAGAILLGLDTERTAWALGLAGTQGSGLFAFTADGAMTKRFHGGDAARAGVVAAELAAAGFTGPTQIFEAADGGFLRAHSPNADPAPLTEGLGVRWLLDDTAFKPYSCCGSLHAYVDAALALRARFGPPAGRRVRLGLPKLVEVQCGYDYAPGSALNAQMSSRYCIAVALARGQVLPSEFTDAAVAAPDVVALAQAIEQSHDPALDAIYPGHFCGWVELEDAPGSGRFERVFMTDPSGAPANPGKAAAMVEKARRLLGPFLPGDRIAALETACLDLEAATARGLVGAVACDFGVCELGTVTHFAARSLQA